MKCRQTIEAGDRGTSTRRWPNDNEDIDHHIARLKAALAQGPAKSRRKIPNPVAARPEQPLPGRQKDRCSPISRSAGVTGGVRLGGGAGTGGVEEAAPHARAARSPRPCGPASHVGGIRDSRPPSRKSGPGRRRSSAGCRRDTSRSPPRRASARPPRVSGDSAKRRRTRNRASREDRRLEDLSEPARTQTRGPWLPSSFPNAARGPAARAPERASPNARFSLRAASHRG